MLIAIPARALRLDLDSAIDRAIRENRSIAIDALNVRSARLGVDRATTRFDVELRPVLEFGTLDGKSTSLYGIEASKLLPGGTGIAARIESENFDRTIGRRARLAVEINQPLFRDFGRLINEEPVAQATSDLRRAERLFYTQRSDLVLDVIFTFENILRLERQVTADENSVERAEALLQSTRAKESLGRTTRIDSLRVELQHGQAQSRLLADRQQLESEYQAFAELLGIDFDEEIVLESSEQLELNLPKPVDAVAQAFDNRLDYAQALQDLEDTKRGTLIAEKLVLPDVTVTGRYTRSDKPFTFGDEDRSRWFFGVRGDTDLNKRAARIDIARAELDETSAEQRIRVIELGITRDVRQAMLRYRRAQAELSPLTSNLENAKTRLELAQRLFEVGRSDNFSVTDAEDAFLEAQTRLLSGQTQATLEAYRYLHTVAALIEFPDILKPGSRLP
ncbi:MAG: hypothetical protein DHS20C01_00980 [marine bacterium B5-7]|nr:MAG: hypothetical protein DHS20C01_00980 [marine bacterium B5-7]